MSEEMVLKIQERADFGTRSSKRMRKAGQVPAVLSHKSDNPIHISISDHDFQMILNKGGRIINLEGAGNAFIKDVQWDHLGDKILHVDFTKVSQDEKLQMDVALILKGIPAGVKEEGYPAVGALTAVFPENNYTGSMCSMTLIAPDWVLTAAHCLCKCSSSSLCVFLPQEAGAQTTPCRRPSRASPSITTTT